MGRAVGHGTGWGAWQGQGDTDSKHTAARVFFRVGAWRCPSSRTGGGGVQAGGGRPTLSPLSPVGCRPWVTPRAGFWHRAFPFQRLNLPLRATFCQVEKSPNKAARREKKKKPHPAIGYIRKNCVIKDFAGRQELTHTPRALTALVSAFHHPRIPLPAGEPVPTRMGCLLQGGVPVLQPPRSWGSRGQQRAGGQSQHG